MLRQQVDHGDDKPYLSLVDFVAPAQDQHRRLRRHAAWASTSSPSGTRRSTTTTARVWVKGSPIAWPRHFAGIYLHEVARRGWYEDRTETLTHDELIWRDSPQAPPRPFGTMNARRGPSSAGDGGRWVMAPDSVRSMPIERAVLRRST